MSYYVSVLKYLFNLTMSVKKKFIEICAFEKRFLEIRWFDKMMASRRSSGLHLALDIEDMVANDCYMPAVDKRYRHYTSFIGFRRTGYQNTQCV